MGYQLKQLASEDLDLIHRLLDCFKTEFEDSETYGGRRPDNEYMQDLLGSDHFIAFVALKEIKDWKDKYRRLLERAQTECPPPDKPEKAKRGRVKQRNIGVRPYY